MENWTSGYSRTQLDDAQERYGLRFPPDLIELGKECVVLANLSKLAFALVVLLERPIWRRGHDQVDAARVDRRQVAGVSDEEAMGCIDLLDRGLDLSPDGFISRKARKIGLWILEFACCGKHNRGCFADVHL